MDSTCEQSPGHFFYTGFVISFGEGNIYFFPVWLVFFLFLVIFRYPRIHRIMEYNAGANCGPGIERLDFYRQRRRFCCLRSGRNVCRERRNEPNFSQTQQNGLRRAKVTRRHSRDVSSRAWNLRERRQRRAMAGLGPSSLEEVIYLNYSYST